jgi:cobalt-precorrin 5A hydrolase
MFDKGIAVVAVTHRGVETAIKIQKALDLAKLNSTVYAPKKYSQNGVVAIDKKLADFTRDIYKGYDGIVAVMATSITIRAVAPLLDGKLIDPAVIGVDASGKFVISLLAGQFGGANDLTHIIAQGINAIPVVTTASDMLGKQSVNELAKSLHLKIENPDSLAAVNSAIINGDRVVVVVMGEAKIPPNAIGAYEVRTARNGDEALEVINNFDAGIIIRREPLALTKFTKPFSILKTRMVIVGLAANKEASRDSIVQAVDVALEKVHVPLSRVQAFATLDSKDTSQAMTEAAAKMHASLEFLNTEKEQSLENPERLDEVAENQAKIGGGNAEHAALTLAGAKSKLILKKTKLEGVSVAIVEAE